MKRNLLELWKYRALIWALVCRHLNARYRGSALGFVWSFLNPLFLIATYSLVFRYYIRFDSIENYTLFLFTGLLPWIWFSTGLLEATGSISAGGSLITKSLFPAHVLPVVSVLTNFANLIFALPLLLAFQLISGVGWSLVMLWLPVVLCLELVFLTGLSLALAALNVYYRDVQHILGNVMTFWFFLCPVLYSSETIPDRFKFTLWLNPVALFTSLYHDMFFSGTAISLMEVTYLFVVSAVTFSFGNWVFNRYRDNFAELVS